MAAQTQGTVQVQELLGMLSRRKWQVILPALVVFSIGIMLATLAPRKYQVQTVLELKESNLPLAGRGADARSIHRDVASASNQINSMERVRGVIEKLEWRDYAVLNHQERYEYLKRVLKNITVWPVAPQGASSSFVFMVYKDADPVRAEQFLNALREAYVREKVEWVRESARKARDTLQNNAAEAARILKEKEQAAAELKSRNSLSPTQQAPGGGRERTEDPVVQQFFKERLDLATDETELKRLERRLESLEKRLAAESRLVKQEDRLPGLDFADQLGQLERDIDDLRLRQKGKTTLNRTWKVLQRDIELLESKREELTEKQSRPLVQVREVPNPQREVLQQEIEACKHDIELKRHNIDLGHMQVKALAARSEELTEIYRQLGELDGDVRRASDAYDAAHLNYMAQRSFVELIDQQEFSPFEVNEYAHAPRKPTEPNVVAILLMSLGLGLGLGAAVALLLEYGRGAYRGTSEVARSLSVPVLGSVNRIVTVSEQRRLRVRQGVVGTATLLLVGTILWVTWAYSNRPRLLGSELTQFIDDVRNDFR